MAENSLDQGITRGDLAVTEAGLSKAIGELRAERDAAFNDVAYWKEQAECARAQLAEKTEVTLSVGDDLFVYGSAAATERCQGDLMAAEGLGRMVDDLTQQLASLKASPQTGEGMRNACQRAVDWFTLPSCTYEKKYESRYVSPEDGGYDGAMVDELRLALSRGKAETCVKGDGELAKGVAELLEAYGKATAKEEVTPRGRTIDTLRAEAMDILIAHEPAIIHAAENEKRLDLLLEERDTLRFDRNVWRATYQRKMQEAEKLKAQLTNADDLLRERRQLYERIDHDTDEKRKWREKVDAYFSEPAP